MYALSPPVVYIITRTGILAERSQILEGEMGVNFCLTDFRTVLCEYFTPGDGRKIGRNM